MLVFFHTGSFGQQAKLRRAKRNEIGNSLSPLYNWMSNVANFSVSLKWYNSFAFDYDGFKGKAGLASSSSFPRLNALSSVKSQV